MADIHIAGKLIPGVVGNKVANAGDIDGLPAAIQAGAAAGPAGADGADGAPGADGAAGASGAQGAAGADGAMGAQGAQGAQGQPGATGAVGPQGPAGSGDGTSTTVQIAGIEIEPYFQSDIVLPSSNLFAATGLVVPVDEQNGYWHINLGEGTSYTTGEWLRVDVAQLFAKDAASAPQSFTFANSLIFASEVQPTANLWLGHTSAGQLLIATNNGADINNFTIRRETYVAGTGPEGAQGPAGADGAAGAAGATGPAGPAGAAGSDGAAGGIGPQGAQGNPGAQGATGPAGDDGDDGAQGNPGAQGSQGIQGNPGAAGAAGDDGAQGATGPAGAAGPAGADGTGDTYSAGIGLNLEGSEFQLKQATDTDRGGVKITAVVDRYGDSAESVITAQVLSLRSASIAESGLVVLGTQAEAIEGDSNFKAVTPRAMKAKFDSLPDGGVIKLTGDLDMDTLTTLGEYAYTKGASTLTNAPAGVINFGLEVFALDGLDGGDLRQWLSTIIADSTFTFERERLAGVFRPWSNVQYVPTDGVTAQVLTKSGAGADDYGWEDAAAGATGAQGVAGPAGAQGDQGAVGAAGPQGVAGPIGGVGDSLEIVGTEVRPYWSGDVNVTTAAQFVATGLVVPLDQRTGYWLVNTGLASGVPDGSWKKIDVAQLFALDAGVAGEVISNTSILSVLTAGGSAADKIYFAHTATGELLISAAAAATDPTPLTIRREVYGGGSTDTPAQFYNFYISHDTSDTAQAGTFPDSGITNHAAAFMNFTQDATGGTTNPFTEATAINVTKTPSSTGNVWPNIEHITSTAGIILKAGVPVSIKSSGGIFLGDAAVPSGVVLAAIIRRVMLNGAAFSIERTAGFRVRAGSVYIPFDDLSYEVLPAADIPYTESRVEFDIIFTDANGAELTNNISFNYWISPETKETVTQPNHILQATNAASPEPQVIFEGDVSAQTAADRVLTLNFDLPTTGVLEFVGDTAQLDVADDQPVADTPGKDILTIGSVRCSDIQSLTVITDTQAMAGGWTTYNKIAMFNAGLTDQTPPADEESASQADVSPGALWIAKSIESNKLYSKIGFVHGDSSQSVDLAPLTIRWIP